MKHVALALSFACSLSAQTQVYDLDPATTERGSSLGVFPPSNGRVYLDACDQYGCEPWVSDGTAAGTIRLADLVPGAEDSFPGDFVGLSNGRTLFRTLYVRVPDDLYATDGTPQGTVRLRGPNLRAWSVVSLGAVAVFHGEEGWTNAGVWRTDGTDAGTMLVQPIPNATAGSGVGVPGVALGAVGLMAVETTNGAELWRSDGTAAGTAFVAALPDELRMPMVAIGKLAYFSMYDAATGEEPWVSDGTTAGTHRLADVWPGTKDSYPRGFVAFAGEVWFSASDPAGGRELWKTDGTTAGTMRALDVVPGAMGSSPSELTPWGSELLFSADDGVTGRELWKTDGTIAGTTRILDIEPGSGDSDPQTLTVFGSMVLFSAKTAALGREIWRSDGTAAGTALVADIDPGAASGGSYLGTVFGNRILFPADDGVHGTELWTTDGTAINTAMVKNLTGPAGTSSDPRAIAGLDESVVVWANVAGTGNEPWFVDPLAAAPVSLGDLSPGAYSSFGGVGTERDGVRLFPGIVPSYGVELWRSDGTAAGTRLLLDLNPGSASGVPAMLFSSAPLVPLGRELLLQADDGVLGSELWATDGTASGTRLVADLRQGPASSSPSLLGRVGAAVLFSALDDTAGRELWRTDAKVGPQRVVDLQPGSGSSMSSKAPSAVLDDVLLFAADDGVTGTELWSSDGTAAGTKQLADLTPGAGGSTIEWIEAAAHQAFLSVRTGGLRNLWRTDGTTGGTVRLRTISVQEPVTSGNLLFFLADDGMSGVELWRSDGTVAGTFMVQDLFPGPASSAWSQPELTAIGVGPLVVLAADDGSGATGREPWLSDGTPGAMRLLADIAPGGLNSDPAHFTVVGDDLWFAAWTYECGRELHRVSLGALGAANVERYGLACPERSGYTPTMASYGVPAIGNGQLSVAVEHGRPYGLGALIVGLGRARMPLGGGCSLYVAPPWIVIGAPVDLHGNLTVPLPLPPFPFLVGQSLYATGAVAHPAGAAVTIGVADALQVVIGQ